MDFLFDGIQLFMDVLKDDSNSTADEELECKSKIDDYLFYQLCLIPAILIAFIMAATKSRRHMFLSVFKGRPGLIIPMNTMTRSSRISYCCAFGATGFLIYEIAQEGKGAVYRTGLPELKSIFALISMFIYGMVFFPLFASLALGTALSYFLGSLYVWFHFAVQIFKTVECGFTVLVDNVLITLPSLLCLAYLSVALPVKCGIAIYQKKYFKSDLGEEPYNETIEQIKKSYQGKHVIKLLRKPEVVRHSSGVVNIVKKMFKDKIDNWTYHNQEGFRYPSRLLSVMFVGGCVVYVITALLLRTVVPSLNKILETLQKALVLFGPEQADEDGDITLKRNRANAVYFMVDIINDSLIVTMSVSCLICLLNIIHMVSSFRTNLFAIYRGDFSHIPPPHQKSAISLCIGSIKFAGFQVAFIVWAFIITSVILFLVCLALATGIELLLFGYTDWLVNRILKFWPGFVTALCLYFFQYLLSKFLFLQDRGQHLRLDNRRFYFIFVYFMFFYNIILGFISCLLRIIKAMILGALFLARLDHSTLPRKFEFLDPGFNAYQGYIHMEAAHTHPVVNVFLRLLVTLSNSRKMHKSSEGDVIIDIDNCKLEGSGDNTPDRPVNIAARCNWFVTYTLLQNPSVRIYRKGFIQSMKKARIEGIKVPISDQPVTDFDLIKALEDREKKEKEEKTQSPAHSLNDGMSSLGIMMGASQDNKIMVKKNKKRQKKHRLFRNWKRKKGNVFFDNVSDERTFGNEFYLKTEKV